MAKLRAIGDSYGLTVQKCLLRQEGYVKGNELAGDYYAHQAFDPETRELTFRFTEARESDLAKLVEDGHGYAVIVNPDMLRAEGYLQGDELTGEYYCYILEDRLGEADTLTYQVPEPVGRGADRQRARAD